MIASFFHPSSYFGIALFLVLTGCGLPLPEEVAIVVAGVLSAQGHLHAGLALLACLIGAIVGDCIMYAIGHRWGHSLLYRHPRIAKLMRADVVQQEERVKLVVATVRKQASYGETVTNPMLRNVAYDSFDFLHDISPALSTKFDDFVFRFDRTISSSEAQVQCYWYLSIMVSGPSFTTACAFA